jgi:hypothetical protein
MEIILDLLKDFVVPTVALFTFIKAIIEYIKVQKWKKSEFLTKEIKEFYKDEDISMICKLLDWNARIVNLNGQDVKINDNFLESALLTHRKKAKFTPEEAILRDKFDYFFDRLSYFNIYIENRLVDEKETIKYLSYYLEILSTPGRKDSVLVKIFQDYISYYEYNNVKGLLNKYKISKS